MELWYQFIEGVSILFKRTHSLNIIVKENIEYGRLTTNKAEINGHEIQTINIYAPNNPGDKKRFFSNLSTVFDNEYAYILVCLFVLRFYGPVNPVGSCRARSVYLTTRLLGRLSPLSG